MLYNNLSSEKIHKQLLDNFTEQLYQDFQNFSGIKKLLEDYSSGKKVPIINDEKYASDLSLEPKTTKIGSRLEDTSKLKFFSLDEVKALSEDRTSLGESTEDIFDFEL